MSLFFSVLSVSASGMAAERTRAELLVENLANSETTRTPEEGLYKRKDAVFTTAPQTSPFSAVFQTEMGSGVNGVEVSYVVEDTREPDKRYMPGHLNLMGASRNFQANVAAMTAIKDMILQSINVMK
jgi:flagellar basal-body rod protein FlgC